MFTPEEWKDDPSRGAGCYRHFSTQRFQQALPLDRYSIIMVKQFLVCVLVLLCTVVAVVQSNLLEGGLCPPHHGVPLKDESAAMEHCIDNTFCHPTQKCMACTLKPASKCAVGAGNCKHSYTCNIAQTGSRNDIKAKADNL